MTADIYPYHDKSHQNRRAKSQMLDETYYRLYIDQLDPPEPLVFVSLSSGCSSAVAAERAIQKYGKDNVELIFADTLIEDDDNYRFLDDLEKRWQKPIIRLRDGRDPYQVAEDEHIIPNQRLAKCSDRLKVEQIQKYIDSYRSRYYPFGTVIIVIGFDYRDAAPRGDKPQGRLPAPRENWAKRRVMVWYPLLDKPIELDSEATVRAWGIKPPRMYAQGYTHANCQGLCVKQGKKDWRRTLTLNRTAFLKVEAWERGMMEWQATQRIAWLLVSRKYPFIKITHRNFDVYTLLRDKREGFGGNMTLEQLRLETETADAHQLRLFTLTDDIGQVCGVECVAG